MRSLCVGGEVCEELKASVGWAGPQGGQHRGVHTSRISIKWARRPPTPARVLPGPGRLPSVGIVLGGARGARLDGCQHGTTAPAPTN